MKTIACIYKSMILCFLLQTISTHIFAQYDTTKTDDNIYGKGGYKLRIKASDTKFWGVDVSTIEIIEIFDANHKVRESHMTIKFPDGIKREYDEFTDCNGKVLFSKSADHDLSGTETYYEEHRYAQVGKNDKGKAISGFKRYIGKDGKKHVMQLNVETQLMEDVKEDVSFTETPFVPNTVSCPPPFIRNEVFAGFSLIREDSKPTNFFTYGGEIQFNHFISPHIGIGADLGLNFGSNAGIDYTKKSVLIGFFDRLSRENTIITKYSKKPDVNVHLLGGVSSVTSSVGSYKSSSTLFTADLGIGLSIPFNKERTFGLGMNLDYIPTFSGTVKNNVKASVGLGFGLRSRHSHSHRNEKIVKRQTID